MALLAGKTYDPTTAVATAAAAATAMAAFDTTNLRLSFTAPPNGSVLVRLRAVIHGAATFSQVLLGVMSGATVMGKTTPTMTLNGTALATTMCPIEAVFLVTGLTAGAAQTWDAAFGFETFVTSSQIKYGGPNDTTANNAFGGFVFEIWSTN